MTEYRFNTPPGWPEPPAGWRPTGPWQADPSWPSMPAGWQLWVPVDESAELSKDSVVSKTQVLPKASELATKPVITPQTRTGVNRKIPKYGPSQDMNSIPSVIPAAAAGSKDLSSQSDHTDYASSSAQVSEVYAADRRKQRRWLPVKIIASVVGALFAFGVIGSIVGNTQHPGRVPDVVGMSVTGAKSTVEAKQFSAAVDGMAMDSLAGDQWEVDGETPAAGTVIAAGTQVKFVVHRVEKGVILPSDSPSLKLARERAAAAKIAQEVQASKSAAAAQAAAEKAAAQKAAEAKKEAAAKAKQQAEAAKKAAAAHAKREAAARKAAAAEAAKEAAAAKKAAQEQTQQQNAVPGGATGLCNDGSYSFAVHHQGMCSHHGGVSEFLD